MTVRLNYPANILTFNIVDDLTSTQLSISSLQMYINPGNMKQTFTKKINRTQTFSAVYEEHWGEELDAIACSGSTGAFISKDGLTTIDRKTSDSYLNFKNLVNIYRNNGCIYDPMTGQINRVGYVELVFSEGIYRGYFENFNVNEDATTPFRITYDFIFKVEQTIIG